MYRYILFGIADIDSALCGADNLTFLGRSFLKGLHHEIL